MRRSRYFLPTLMNDPSDADTVSSRLMIRAGMIRKLASGLYEWLPLGLRVLKKIENIVREEMNKIEAQELSLPLILPRQLWEETGRWEKYGKELIRIKDRKDMDFCLAPTHEELITHIVRNEVRSYKELPLILYQFGLKYRDEIRPRFGVIRAREFYMKDAYSFHATEECAENYYRIVCDAYSRICQRCGVRFKIVEASSGLIGGKLSHEFMVLANTGEEEIIVCENCNYASNVELACSEIPKEDVDEEILPLEEVYTPNLKTVEEVSSFLRKPPEKFIKCLIYIVDKKPIAILIRGDREVNESKLKNFLAADEVSLADRETIEEITNSPVGFAGPVGLKNVEIIADNSVINITNAISGANKKDFHLMNININRDYKPSKILDIKKVKANDLCIHCKSKLSSYRGVEVAHTFKLGKVYSEPMNATFLDSDGKRKNYIMGCYGVGVSRMVAAIIEQSHDENGIIWPISVAPFLVYIIPINYNDDKIREVSDEIYKNLISEKIEVILDDRDEHAGVKFKDADLIGIPIRLVISQKSLKNNQVEIKLRWESSPSYVSINEVVNRIKKISEGVS